MDTELFRDAVRATAPGQALLLACRRLRAWVDLPEPDALREITAALADERMARALVQAKPVVSQRLLREVLPPDADRDAAFAALIARLQQASTTVEEQGWYRRATMLNRIVSLAGETWPGAVAPPAAVAHQDEMLRLLPDLQQAMEACGAGRVTAERVQVLVAAVERFRAAAAEWTPPVPGDHAWWLGMAGYALGRAYLELGDAAHARDAFSDGAVQFELAGDAEQAADLRQRIEAIDTGRRADFDRQIAPTLRALGEWQPPLQRVAALCALAEATHHAGDRFEFVRLAREIAQLLERAGYADPEPDLEAALDRWVKTAVGEPGDVDLFKRLSDVGARWALVMGARSTDRLPDGSSPDAAGSERAAACVQRIGAVLMKLFDEASAVRAGIDAELAEWFGQSFDALPAGIAASSDEAARVAAEGVAINHALYELRLACNVAAAQSQLGEADALIARAVALGSRIHVAQAWLERAYVLLALQRHGEVANATDAALRALAGQTDPVQAVCLERFTTSAERELYLSAKLFAARARAAQRDFAALLAICEPVIGELETQRTRVSAPYQQAAFLSTRVEFYEFAAAAARALGRVDLLLATTEQLKASQAWRLCGFERDAVRGEDARELAELEAHYAALNRALATAPASGARTQHLDAERRRVAAARALARRRLDERAPPVCTEAALRMALAPDEAALSWCWLGDRALVLLACTRERVEPVLIELADDDRQRLDAWVQAVGALSAPAPDVEALAPQIESLIDALAPVLLPPAARRLVQDKQRLILSPHRVLHLFPIHAARWSTPRTGEAEVLAAGTPSTGADAGRWMVECFAIRYAPNLASLVVPWSGNRLGPVLAVGVGAFDDASLPPLANAVAEAAEVAAAHPRGMHADNCTRAAFLALPLATCRCLHLATHGSSVLTGNAADDPQQCAVAMADGWLDGWQLAALALPAELVVVAACYSGQRAIGGRGLARLPGDDLFGLQAVLFEAGAGSVLGALWPVEDDTARRLLVDFHRHYAAGSAPERALQRALIAHLADHARRRLRFSWAPFFLTSLRNPNPAAIATHGEAHAASFAVTSP